MVTGQVDGSHICDPSTLGMPKYMLYEMAMKLWCRQIYRFIRSVKPRKQEALRMRIARRLGTNLHAHGLPIGLATVHGLAGLFDRC